MKIKETSYWNIFKSTLLISTFTFGGGYVIVPLMRKRFVEDFKWIDEQEMLDLVAIAQSSPGAMAVNTSVIVGYRVRGVKGALISTIGTVIPPLFIITFVSIFYEAFKSNDIVNRMLSGMQLGIAAIVLNVVIELSIQAFKDTGIFAVVVMIVVCIGIYVFNISIILIVLLSVLVGFLRFKVITKGDVLNE